MPTHLNWIDTAFIVLFVFSVTLGLFRGLISEVISCITWISAFVVASLFSVDIAARFRGAASSSALTHAAGAHHAQTISVLAISISFICLFVMTLIVGSIINYLVSRMLAVGGFRFSDRLLGGLFGFVRGVLISLIVIFLAQLSPLAEEGLWQNSRAVETFQPAIRWLSTALAPHLEGLKNRARPVFKALTDHIS